uniref:Hexosyltransferase n=1 Tax=Alexandrium andersonii TaxID=327968 RepID=A0A7S2GLG6_9DINO
MDYRKVLMLDLDMLVRGSLDELFLLRPPAALRRSSGREQPPHGGGFRAQDLWRRDGEDMCSGINAGVMLLEPNRQAYDRMVEEIQDTWHPEHIGTYGPEQDYLARFYCAFFDGQWTHIHAKFNYQLMLPDDYCSSAHRALDVERDVCVAHYSGPRVKPWKIEGDLDVAGAARLLHDDSIRELFGREQRSFVREQRGGSHRPQPRERIMDGVPIMEDGGQASLPAVVQSVMWEWVLALRKCTGGLKEEGVDVLSILREVQSMQPPCS